VEAAPVTLLSAVVRLMAAEAAGQNQRVAAIERQLDDWVSRSPEDHGRAIAVSRVILSENEAVAAAARESVLNVTPALRAMGRQADGPLAELLALPLTGDMAALKDRIAELRSENARFAMQLRSAQDQPLAISLGDIHTIVPSNQLGVGEKLSVYFARWWGYLSEDPREANMAGGIFPHIVGTVLMVIIMCVLVVPFGVLAALYIREYAKAGFVVSAIRVAINNLAGVPSIVYGVFGLGFFIYIVGAYMDGGPSSAEITPLPSGGWFALLGAFALMVIAGAGAAYLNRRTFIERDQPGKVPGNIVAGLIMAGAWAFVLYLYAMWWSTTGSVAGAIGRLLVGGVVLVVVALAARPVFTDVNDRRSLVSRLMYLGGVLTCILAALAGVAVIATTPFFDGFANAHVAINTPFWGKGALIWASFTLALLTLPVVIVATEEALSAVPNSMREGSYACGASKWQTIKRIVLPRAMPGIMTGTILAMARGAGEVAPLMIVGVVAFTQELPATTHASEAFGVNRSFLHLGFHIYNMGFQSQDSEGAKPLVYVTTLLLIVIVAVLNLSAIYLRSRLKRRFVSSAF
jgi:ABC-type phosphate transport system permease subunit